jgi:hypothetical protein
LSTTTGEVVKLAVSSSLLVLMAAIGVYLWVIDQSALQRVYAALLASELTAFGMLIYAHSKQQLSDSSVNWMLLGLAALAFLLFYSLILAAGAAV